jgi:isoleucyl-tRNA synthetase
VTDAFERFDLKSVYQETINFSVLEVAEFYLDFSKYRRRRLAGQVTQNIPLLGDGGGNIHSSML